MVRDRKRSGVYVSELWDGDEYPSTHLGRARGHRGEVD